MYRWKIFTCLLSVALLRQKKETFLTEEDTNGKKIGLIKEIVAEVWGE